MNIRGKAWCANCGQEQPASLVGLSINGAEKTVTGLCMVCEHPVQRTFTYEPKKAVIQKNLENNCVQLYSKDEDNKEQTLRPVTETKEVEHPSWFTLVALFSVCLVITYFL